MYRGQFVHFFVRAYSPWCAEWRPRGTNLLALMPRRTDGIGELLRK